MSHIWSKLLGILSSLYISYQAEVTYPIKRGAAIYHCDCSEALTTALTKHRPSVGTATQDNHDIIMEIFQIRKYLKTTITIGKVQKDKDYKIQPPDVASLEEAAHIAHTFGSKSPNRLVPRSSTMLLPGHKISVQVQTTILTSKESADITTSIHKPGLIKKIEKDTKWSYQVMQAVDWQSLGRAASTISRPARIKFTKLMFSLHQTNYLR
jgi:hypothetical protein